MIEQLKARYGFVDATLENNQLLTDHGTKRLEYWQDKALLDWHTNWRDSCSVTPTVLMDRMIRTKDGKPFIKVDGRYITVHDHIAPSCLQKGYEQQWGTLLGAMVANGRKESKDREERAKPLEELECLLPSLEPEQQKVVKGLWNEAEKRQAKAEKLAEEQKKQPLMDRIEAPEQSGILFHILVVKGTTKPPEVGYGSMMRFLKNWYTEHGQESFCALLNALDAQAALTTPEKKALLAEGLQVHELDPLLSYASGNRDKELAELVKHAVSDWDKTRTFVSAFASWLDEKRVKA
jgi:hypothetical protein